MFNLYNQCPTHVLSGFSLAADFLQNRHDGRNYAFIEILP
jgi:hypothetical protein